MRASWIVLIAVAVLTLAVPSVRQQAVVPLTLDRFAPVSPEALTTARGATPLWIVRYQQDAPTFVAEQAAGDASLQMAAGLLTPDRPTARALLERAAETENSPIAWSTYVEALLADTPEYGRVGVEGADPEQPESIALAKQTIRAAHRPGRLSSRAVTPLLSAVKRWQRTDPNNALPVGLEAYLLYGLHHDAAALVRWQRAGDLPRAQGYWRDMTYRTARLLTRMGVPEAEAILESTLLIRPGLGSYARVRSMARAAAYEGRLAAQEGRPAEAIAWWRATSELGRHVEDSADTMIAYLVGASVQSIGAAPAWKWYSDETTHDTGGPLANGRLLYGTQHAFYLQQVGDAAEAELRDQLASTKVRTHLLHAYATRYGADNAHIRSLLLAGIGGLAGALALLHLLYFVTIRGWRRPSPEAAGALTRRWQIASVAVVFAPFAVIALISYLLNGRTSLSSELMDRVSFFCLGLSVIAGLATPWLAARASGQPLFPAWRGGLLHVLPPIAATAAVLFLTFTLISHGQRQAWVREWSDPSATEMARLVQHLGPTWAHPRLPKDAWRAEAPREMAQR